MNTRFQIILNHFEPFLFCVLFFTLKCIRHITSPAAIAASISVISWGLRAHSAGWAWCSLTHRRKNHLNCTSELRFQFILVDLGGSWGDSVDTLYILCNWMQKRPKRSWGKCESLARWPVEPQLPDDHQQNSKKTWSTLHASIIQPFMHQAFLSCIVLPCLPYLAVCLSESPVSPVYLSIHISYTYPSIHPSMHACQRSHSSSYNQSISHPILSYVLVCSDVPGFICGCDIQNYYHRWLSTATKVKLFQSTKLSICLSEASCVYGTGDGGLRAFWRSCWKSEHDTVRPPYDPRPLNDITQQLSESRIKCGSVRSTISMRDDSWS